MPDDELEQELRRAGQPADIEICFGGQRYAATADALGRFELTAAGSGPISLRFRLADPASGPIVTEWVRG
jgi:hypothetical protein